MATPAYQAKKLLAINNEVIKALSVATIATLGLFVAIWIGSHGLSHFDAALAAYMLASIGGFFGVVYRYTMWLQRPPTAMYWKRGLQLLFGDPLSFIGNLFHLLKEAISQIVFNRFIFKRGTIRGIGHWLIMWGCFIAAGITFPLVFGWLSFAAVEGEPHTYQIIAFTIPTIKMDVHSLFAESVFHGLVIASLLVIPGVMLVMRRRMRDRDTLTTQSFLEDILPLFMLFAVSLSGLLLTVSYTWMHGYAYTFLSGFHALTVIFTLLWMPFGKFFHIFQRPAQLGVVLYKKVGSAGPQAKCLRCQEPFASQMHVDDLKHVQKALGYHYDLPSHQAHYQDICPRCRRHCIGLSQGALWQDSRINPHDDH